MQDSVSHLESNNTVTVGYRKCNIAETKEKIFKIGMMNIIKFLKEYINNFIYK